MSPEYEIHAANLREQELNASPRAEWPGSAAPLLDPVLLK
jgi:hypothetical protein